jgi:hypothetical protein
MSRRKSAEGRLSPTLRKGLAHIRSCEKSGETLKSYAERRGLSVRSLYDAKKKLRVHGIVAPHGKPPAASATPRKSQPRRFIEAIRRADEREGTVSWRVRFSSGELLESTRPLSFDETLRLIETLRGRA